MREGDGCFCLSLSDGLLVVCSKELDYLSFFSVCFFKCVRVVLSATIPVSRCFEWWSVVSTRGEGGGGE